MLVFISRWIRNMGPVWVTNTQCRCWKGIGMNKYLLKGINEDELFVGKRLNFSMNNFIIFFSLRSSPWFVFSARLHKADVTDAFRSCLFPSYIVELFILIHTFVTMASVKSAEGERGLTRISRMIHKKYKEHFRKGQEEKIFVVEY